MAMEGSHLETGLDPCLTADRRSALLHRDLNWTAISKYQETKKATQIPGNIWALTKIYIGFEFGKRVRLNWFTVSVTTIEYMH